MKIISALVDAVLHVLGFLILAAATYVILDVQCRVQRSIESHRGTVAATGSAQQVFRPSGRIRIATWNMMWLEDYISSERRRNIRKVIHRLNADVLALQEVSSMTALRNVLPDEYEIAMAPAGSGALNLAVAVRAPVSLVSDPVAVFEGDLYDDAFPDQRDPLRAYISLPSGNTVALYVVHYKSRRGGRASTEMRRVKASCLLAAWIRSNNEENVIVLGDFNDTPDDACANILETGNLLEVGRIENEPDTFLVNLCEPLAIEDYVTVEVYQLFRGMPIEPIAPGAREDNDRLRGKDYAYPAEVLVQQALFDQIFVSPNLASRVKGNRATIYSHADALIGSKGGHGLGSLASDHLPVFIDLEY